MNHIYSNIFNQRCNFTNQISFKNPNDLASLGSDLEQISREIEKTKQTIQKILQGGPQYFTILTEDHLARDIQNEALRKNIVSTYNFIKENGNFDELDQINGTKDISEIAFYVKTLKNKNLQELQIAIQEGYLIALEQYYEQQEMKIIERLAKHRIVKDFYSGKYEQNDFGFIVEPMQSEVLDETDWDQFVQKQISEYKEELFNSD